METDHARQRFVRTRFGQDIDNPLLYDLVVNTDRMTPIAVARLIVEALRHRVLDLKEAGQTASMFPFPVPVSQF